MIKFISNGSLFDSKCNTWVNTVNCVGVMGKGIALEFKKRFPEMFEKYKTICRNNGFRPGTIQWYYNKENPEWILNVATKDHWRNPSKIEWIESIVSLIRNDILQFNIPSISIPALGCSNGGLKFADVKSIIIEGLKDLDCYIEVYEPL